MGSAVVSLELPASPHPSLPANVLHVCFVFASKWYIVFTVAMVAVTTPFVFLYDHHTKVGSMFRMVVLLLSGASSYIMGCLLWAAV